MAKADELKAKIGLSGPPLERLRGIPPLVPDHKLVRRIGQGSYGEVWLAQSAVGTWRAVKVVYRDHFQDARPYDREFAGIQKFEPISRTDEGLVDVLQIGRNDEEGYFYYVMELADSAVENQQPGYRNPKEIRMANGDAEPSSQGAPNSGFGIPSTFDMRHSESYVPKTLAREIKSRGRLSVEECITLGLTLNLALGHLHRNGLIHRDVKPSNIIFVNGVPKLADIGLVTDLAGAQSFVGTEGFIPPEGPNSPQADLYALGKVLYEASMGKDRQEFPEPFTALGMDAESKALMELNEVLLRACADKTKERYQTAEEMNADLALLHSGKSVQSRHALERRLKLMTRIGVAAAAVVVLGAFPYFVAIREAQLAKSSARKEIIERQRADFAAQQAETARQQADADAQKARTEAAKRQQVAEFLEQMLEGVRPSVALGHDTTILRDILDKAVERVGKKLINQPEVQLELLETLSATYDDLGLYQQESDVASQALEIARAHCETESTEVATAVTRLGVALWHLGKPELGEPLIREGLEIRKKVLGAERVEVAESLRFLAGSQGSLAEAETIYRESLALYRKLLGDDNREVANLLNELGLCLRGQYKLSEAELILRDCLDRKRRLFGDNHPDVAEALNDLALALQSLGKLVGAETLFRESLQMTRRMWAPEHRNVTLSFYNLAGVLRAQGRLAEAEGSSREAVTLARKQRRADWLLPLALNGLSVTLLAEDKLAEAEQVLRETLEVRRNVMGGEDSRTAYPLANLAEALQRQGRYEEAEQPARRSLALWEDTLPDKWRFFSTQSLLGASLAAQKKYAAAEPLLISGYEGMKAREDRMPVDSRVKVKEALQRLVGLYEETRRPDQAAEWKQKLAEFEKVGAEREAVAGQP